MSNPEIYIIILNYRQWQDTRDCLVSVLKSSYRNYSVIIIDNDSQNNSLENIINPEGNDTLTGADYKIYKKKTFDVTIDWKNFPRITLIQNDRNAGFAGGNNIVLRLLANLDAFVWLLNPDMILGEETLSELVDFAVRQTADCIVGAQVRSYAGKQELLFYGGGKINFLSGTVQLAKNQRSADRLDYISGGCLFTHASNFKKYGVLPEEYFLYWEETEWCYRAKLQGVALLVCSSSVCYDKVSTVIGKGFLSDYYYCRNGLLFISKFRKKNVPISLFAMMIRWIKRIVTGQWDRSRGVWRGTIDFLKKKFNEAQ